MLIAGERSGYFDDDECHAIDRLNAVRKFKCLRKLVPTK